MYVLTAICPGGSDEFQVKIPAIDDSFGTEGDVTALDGVTPAILIKLFKKGSKPNIKNQAF